MITFITGPMMSGKSTELLRYLERSIRGKKKVCLIRPEIDTRDKYSHSIATELNFNSLSIPTYTIKSFEDVMQSDLYNVLWQYDVIGIDEIQFIKDAYKFYVYATEKDLYYAGLLATSECEVFPEINKLLPYCDNIIKLNAVCSVCGYDLGNYTFYKEGNKTESIKVGDSKDYEGRCLHCYLDGRMTSKGCV